VRTTRKLSLTEVGERVYAASAGIRQNLELAHEAVSTHTGSMRGTLRVTAPVALGRRHVMPLVAEFLAQHPALQVELLCTDAFVDLVDTRIDVALRAGFAVDSSLVTRRLAKVALRACASPSYLELHRMPRSPSDLETLDLIQHLPRTGPTRLTFRKGRRQLAVELHGRLASNDGAACVQAAVDGFGVCLAPDFEFSDEVRAGRLVPLLTDWSLDSLVLSAVFPPRRHVSGKVRAFSDFVAERWREPPWRLS
jgi:DNA-binding transcriptional LysR family regulator